MPVWLSISLPSAHAEREGERLVSANPAGLDTQIAAMPDVFNVKAQVVSTSLYTDRFLPSKADRLPPASKE